MKTTIQVELIEYFNDDEKLMKLNENRKYFESPNLKIPFIKLENNDTVEAEDHKSTFQSLISYVEKNKISKPNIITNEPTLTKIASGGAVKIHVFRNSDFIFMWIEEEIDEEKKHEKVLRTYFTRSSDTSKALFKTRVPIGKDYCSILYSGEVDGIDESNHHYSFHVISSATSTLNFWENKSSNFFWKSVFGMIPFVVIGTRTGEKEKDPKTKPPLNYPEMSVYKIEKLDRDSIPVKAYQFADRPRSTFIAWNIVDGEKRLQDFMKLVVEEATEGRSYLMSREDGNEKWIMEEAEDILNLDTVTF